MNKIRSIHEPNMLALCGSAIQKTLCIYNAIQHVHKIIVFYSNQVHQNVWSMKH